MAPRKVSSPSPKLTHANAAAKAKMVSVGQKSESQRVAVATAMVRMSIATLTLIEQNTLKKGDVLSVARVAALAGLKRTADLIPLCHPVRVVGSDVELTLDPKLPGVRIRCRVEAFDRTGVEMEAMTGASVAALTIYDMVKGVERGVTIETLALESKSGGRSGGWHR